MILRHELKFQIDALEHDVLQKKLRTVLKPDPNMKPRDWYNVRTLYFDDYKDSALQEKEAGIYKRKKYRLRIYNHSDSVIKFECKNKIGSHNYKETARINRKLADQLIVGDYSSLTVSDNDLLKGFYLESRYRLMRPVVIVEYERQAFIHPIGNVRITFDTCLRVGFDTASFFNKNIPLMRVLDPLDTILEVKYNEVIPQYIRGLFPDTIPPHLAIGKFVICRSKQINQRSLQ